MKLLVNVMQLIWWRGMSTNICVNIQTNVNLNCYSNLYYNAYLYNYTTILQLVLSFLFILLWQLIDLYKHRFSDYLWKYYTFLVCNYKCSVHTGVSAKNRALWHKKSGLLNLKKQEKQGKYWYRKQEYRIVFST